MRTHLGTSPTPSRPNSLGSTKKVGDRTVYRRDQPHGEDGTTFSLINVAKKITEGRLHPMVRAWTTKVLAKAGNPKGPRYRAEAILKELRTLEGFPNATRWVPDPTDAEYIANAELTLGDGTAPPLFALGDCDDLTVAFGSSVLAAAMYLSAAESVGAKAAVVGHAYSKDKNIVHVLGAIWDEGRWWYADPSIKDLPFGECKPFTRERVYQVPSLELLCDADVCLTGRGPASGAPPPARRGDFVSVSGPGDDVADSLQDLLDPGPSTLMGFCDLSGCRGEDDVDELARATREVRRTEECERPSDEEIRRAAHEAEKAARVATKEAASAWTEALDMKTMESIKRTNAAAQAAARAQISEREAYAQQAACEEECLRMPPVAAVPYGSVGACCGQDEIGQSIKVGPGSLDNLFPSHEELMRGGDADRKSREGNARTNASIQLAREASEVAQQARKAAAVAWARAQSVAGRRKAEQDAAKAAEERAIHMRAVELVARQSACKQRCAEQNPYRRPCNGCSGGCPGCSPQQARNNDLREAHAAARIKGRELENQGEFNAAAQAPCMNNPLAWNIVDVPPQTDYAAQELYAPWHDGLEPRSGASWEIPGSAYLPTRTKE